MTIKPFHPKSMAQSGKSENASKTERKFYLMQGGQYLHWSASKLTEKRSEAWSGSEEQARKCRLAFAAAARCTRVSVASITPTIQPVGEDA